MLNYTTLLKLQMHIAVCFKMPYHDLRIVKKIAAGFFLLRLEDLQDLQ